MTQRLLKHKALVSLLYIIHDNRLFNVNLLLFETNNSKNVKTHVGKKTQTKTDFHLCIYGNLSFALVVFFFVDL